MSETYDPNSFDATLSRIETSLKDISVRQCEHSEKLDKALERVGDLERFKYWILGMAAAIGAASAKLMNIIGITKH
jgi:hypothetical protein